MYARYVHAWLLYSNGMLKILYNIECYLIFMISPHAIGFPNYLVAVLIIRIVNSARVIKCESYPFF